MSLFFSGHTDLLCVILALRLELGEVRWLVCVRCVLLQQPHIKLSVVADGC